MYIETGTFEGRLFFKSYIFLQFPQDQFTRSTTTKIAVTYIIPPLNLQSLRGSTALQDVIKNTSEFQGLYPFLLYMPLANLLHVFRLRLIRSNHFFHYCIHFSILPIRPYKLFTFLLGYSSASIFKFSRFMLLSSCSSIRKSTNKRF